MRKRRSGPQNAPPLALVLDGGNSWAADVEGMLAREGYQSVRIPALADAISILASGAANVLILCAVRLDSIDRVAFESVRKSPSSPVIILVAPTSSPSSLKAALEGGVTAVLPWPSPSDAIRRALANRKAVVPQPDTVRGTS